MSNLIQLDGVATNRMAAVRSKLVAEGIVDELLHDYTLMVSFPLAAGQTSYPLTLNQENNPPAQAADTTQMLLPANDFFFPVFGAFGVKKVIKVGGVPTNYARPVFTYPDLFTFDAANEKIQVSSLFAGSALVFTAENEEVIYSLSTKALSYAPTTQAAAAAQAGSGSLQDMEGWYCFSKHFGLAGRTQNKVTVQIAGFSPTADIAGDSAATATEGNYVVVMMHGLLARGGEKAGTPGACNAGSNKYLTY